MNKNFEDLKIVYTMKMLSLKLDDNIFNETELVISGIKKSRNVKPERNF